MEPSPSPLSIPSQTEQKSTREHTHVVVVLSETLDVIVTFSPALSLATPSPNDFLDVPISTPTAPC
jgi:hypothetical protein